MQKSDKVGEWLCGESYISRARLPVLFLSPLAVWCNSAPPRQLKGMEQ
jgi:hypothetical protein